MLGPPLLAAPLLGIVHRVQEWPVASQQQARRNAMVAATACAQRRAEREEVADYLASLDDSSPVAPLDAGPAGLDARAATGPAARRASRA